MHLPVSKGTTHQGVSGKSLGGRTRVVTDSAASRKLDGSLSSAGGSANTSNAASPKLEKPQEVLPCPRCESMNTKFCYYNNYSVNQPRHFCRQCQRYWTVGGTLRNVPVGGGSRKRNRRGATEPYPRPSDPAAMGNPPSFQHFLAHDLPGSFLFSQMSTPSTMPQITSPYNLGASYPVMDQSGQFVTPPSSKANLPPMYGTGLGDTSFPVDLSTGNHQSSDGVKTEFWSHQTQVQPGVWEGQNRSDPAAESVKTLTSEGHVETNSSMLLQLGLTNGHPPPADQKIAAGADATDSAVPVAPKNSSSPPHGSSTIEEEGNTPTNCYSNSGYEEGDAVSSMWAHNMHDMQDILSSTL